MIVHDCIRTVFNHINYDNTLYGIGKQGQTKHWIKKPNLIINPRGCERFIEHSEP